MLQDIDFSKTRRVVMAALAQTGGNFITTSTLNKHVCCSRQSLHKTLNRMVKAGILEQQRSGRGLPNGYKLTKNICESDNLSTLLTSSTTSKENRQPHKGIKENMSYIDLDTKARIESLERRVAKIETSIEQLSSIVLNLESLIRSVMSTVQTVNPPIATTAVIAPPTRPLLVDIIEEADDTPIQNDIFAPPPEDDEIEMPMSPQERIRAAKICALSHMNECPQHWKPDEAARAISTAVDQFELTLDEAEQLVDYVDPAKLKHTACKTYFKRGRNSKTEFNNLIKSKVSSIWLTEHPQYADKKVIERVDKAVEAIKASREAYVPTQSNTSQDGHVATTEARTESNPRRKSWCKSPRAITTGLPDDIEMEWHRENDFEFYVGTKRMPPQVVKVQKVKREPGILRFRYFDNANERVYIDDNNQIVSLAEWRFWENIDPDDRFFGVPDNIPAGQRYPSTTDENGFSVYIQRKQRD